MVPVCDVTLMQEEIARDRLHKVVVLPLIFLILPTRTRLPPLLQLILWCPFLLMMKKTYSVRVLRCLNRNARIIAMDSLRLPILLPREKNRLRRPSHRHLRHLPLHLVHLFLLCPLCPAVTVHGLLLLAVSVAPRKFLIRGASRLTLGDLKRRQLISLLSPRKQSAYVVPML